MSADQTSDEYLTVAEAAAHIKISETTCRRFIRAGKLPVRRFGARSIRIRASDLENLADGTAPAATSNPAVEPLPADLAEHVRQLVNNAPPLSPAQLSCLAALLGGAPE